MPRRLRQWRNPPPVDDNAELLEDLDRPITAEEVLETFSTPSLEGIARILGTLPENSWGQALRAVVSPEAQATARINRSGTRTQRISRGSISNRPQSIPLIRILQNQDVAVDEETHELVRSDEAREWPLIEVPEPEKEQSRQIRKMKGKIVICQKAMRGGCPVLIGRAETEDSMTLDDFWCVHMVPHAHRGDQCGEPYEREYSLPKKPLRRQSCKYSQCAPMEAVPEHRRWQTEKKSKGKLITHKRTLII